MAVVVIYIVLGVLYESFTHPLTILSGLPAAGLGALLTLMIFNTELNLYAFVGVIMLVGLVKKNGIMMVDFAVELQRQGKSPAEAIHEACLVRFRPIMMTTMAALVGTLPIASWTGCRCRVAPAAWTGSGRRVAGLAATDALHHARVLRLHRGRPRSSDASSRGARASRGRGRRPLDQLPTLQLSNSQFICGKLGVGSWRVDLFHVPVPRHAEADAPEIVPG